MNRAFLKFLPVLMAVHLSAFAQQSKNTGLPELKWNYTSFTERKVSERDLWLQYNKGQEQHPEIGRLYAYAPNTSCIEEIGKRTEFEKHYISKNDPAAFSVQKSYMPLHYKKNGAWYTIDYRLQVKSPGVYEAGNQQEPVGFDISRRESYIVTPQGKVAFNHWKLCGKNAAGEITELATANWSKVTAGDDGIRVSDIFAGIDAEMHVVRGAVKTNFIVKENKYKAFRQLIFRDRFASSEAYTLKYKNGPKGPAVLASTDQNLLQLEKAFAYPEKQSGAHTELPYELQGDMLGIAIDVAYIEKYIGSGHVVIDPLVSGSATLAAASMASMYNASCNFVDACTYSISVPTPAGATFTDVFWTMGIVATSPCGRENGGFRISSGSCLSPNATSFWTCSDGAGGTATGPGSCAGVNISGMSTFSSCLPAPACTSSNVSFSVMMYRGCVGPTGCDNTCIGTASPFTITIQGRTVEYANGIVRSTAKDSVCSGATVILSKVTQNGIPPYSTTNWSSSRTGSPSLGTGDSLTISYPAGTYWFYARTTDACSNLAIDSQRIYVDSVLLPAVTIPVVYCQGQTPSALTATASSASHTLYWHTSPSGGGGSTTAPVPSTASVGSTPYYVSQKSGLGCDGARSTINVQVNRTPAAPVAPSPINYCQDASPVALTATKPDATDTLLWYTGPSGGIGSTTAITPSTSSLGSVTYYVSAKSSLNCEGPRTAVTVQVNRVPTAPAATSPIAYCKDATSVALTATKPDATDTLLWYTAASGGTGSTTTITPSTTSVGSVIYYVSAKSSMNCEGPRTPITVQINRVPTAPVVTAAISFCQNTIPVALTATKPDVTDTLLWYTSASGGTGSLSAIEPPTSATGTTTYYVSAKSALNCEGPRSAIAVTIDPAPGSPTVTSPLSYCQDASASVLTATKLSATDTLYWYTAAIGGTGTTTAPVPSTATAGMVNYYVGERNTFGCDGTRATISVFTSPAIPSFEIKTADSILCLGESAILSTRTGTTDSLTSTIVNNNNQNGVMFDISAKRTITINAFEVNTDNVTDAPVAIYYKTGTHVSFESSSSAWTLLGLTTITGTENSYTKVPLPLNVTIPAGQSAAFYITHTNGALINYSNGSGVGNIITQDTNIQIFEGVAKAYPFAATYTPRRFEGKVHYSTVAVTWSTGSTLDTITVAPTTTSKYWARIANTLGCKNTDTIQVQVNPIPAAPAVSTPVIYCQGETPVALPATKASLSDTLYWYSGASGGTGSTTQPVLSTSAVSSTTYYVSQRSIWGCEGSRAAITVQVNRKPTAPVAASPIVYCQYITPVALTATKPDPTDTLLWYTAASGGTGSLTAITPSTATAGTFTYYVSAKSSLNCEGPRSAITVTVNPTPTAPVVVTPVVYCQGEASLPLSATKLLATDTVLWYTTATGGTPSMLTTTPSTATAGTTIHYVSLKTALGCEGPRSSISVTINPTPTAPAVTTPVIYCQGASASALTAVLASPADSLIWYTVASGGTGSATAPTPLTGSTGTTTYYVSGKTTLTCEGGRSAIDVTVNPTPAAPAATAAIPYCQNATAVPLTATKASTSDTLYWYTVATGGTGSIVAPIPVTTTAGTFHFYVSAKNTSKCEGPRTHIIVTINATPAAPTVTSPVNLCIGGSSSALTAGGTGLLWYTSSSGGTGTATAPVPPTSIASTIVHYVSQTISGCEGPRASITVTVNNLPAAPAVVTPVIYCQNSTATALTAPKGATDTLIWYTAASGGTGTSIAPVPSTTATGSTTSYVSVRSQYKCEGGRSAITVTVNPTPAAPVVTTPVVYCKDATPVALIATKSTSSDTLKWYTVSSGGTASLTATVPSTATAGTFFGYVSQTNTFKCESPRSTITITINPLPATPGITTPRNLCLGGPSSALTATGTSIKWYTAATGGTGSSTAPTPSTTSTGTTTYYVTQTESVNFCESPRAALNVVVNPLPVAPTVATPLNLCIGSTAVPLTAIGTSLKWYTVATGGTGSSTAPTPSTAALGSTTYYVSQTSSVGCEGPRTNLEVAVQPLPVVTITPVGVSAFFYCDGKRITIKANSATATSYQWYSGSALIPGATKDTLSTGTTGNYKVQVANIYGCKAEATVYVQKDTTAYPILTPATVSICEEGSALLNCHPAYTSFIFEWFKDGTPATPPTPKSSVRSVSLPGTYKITVTNLYGCINTTNDAIVTLYPKPVKPTVVRMDPILGLSPSSYRYYQWYRNGSKIFGATGANYTFSSDGSYYAQITDSNGCLNYSDTININGLSIGTSKANQANIKVYPNPTRNTINIEAPFAISVQVLDMVGKIVFEQKDATIINLEHFADGTYMLRMFDETKQLVGVERINKVSN